MAEFLSDLVVFTEPIVVGLFAMIAVGGWIWSIGNEQSIKTLASHAQAAPRTSVVAGLVLALTSGVVSDEATYYVLEQWAHDRVIDQQEAELATLKKAKALRPQLVCALGCNVRDVTGVLSRPLATHEDRINPIRHRANYSLRLVRGILFWTCLLTATSLIWLLVGWRRASGKDALRLAVSSLMFVTAAMAWVGAGQEYHRTASYDTLRNLLSMNKPGECDCADKAKVAASAGAAMGSRTTSDHPPLQ